MQAAVCETCNESLGILSYPYLFITKHAKMQGLVFTKKCPLLHTFCPGLTHVGFHVISSSDTHNFLAYFPGYR